MTRRLARLADIAYRRRGRMVLAWIVATVVLIGLGSSLAGEFHADYNTPGSESKAASEFTKREFSGYSGQEIYVVWKNPQGVDNPATKRQMNAFFSQAEKVEHVERRGAIRVSEDDVSGVGAIAVASEYECIVTLRAVAECNRDACRPILQ